ncbi:Cyclin/Brf1-like TBP-binding protein [Raphanus sativus]|uniref:Transcription factor IIIB 60 kDa subunit-like n=1 Tax=Raphanus sativus TaxID=3726 RepID=A0A6J0JQ72_RAPSA|nr:transcription factor IIIB 60 kDa subunit-like [Raphanus sativus]KAJ4887460.1 Cyclin/Brf1-like TBP-binding protein [Raphanus sativus]
MVWCNHCAKKVDGFRPEGGALACNKCGRILENFNFSDEVTFIKNAAGQSQASGNIVSSVQSGITSSRERRNRIARDELMNLRDALQMGDDSDVVVNMAFRLFGVAADRNFTKGRRSELVLSSCLYLACRKRGLAFLLIDFSSYLRVSVYELGSVYLQLCELLFLVQNDNYEELVDPSIFIERFTKSLLKGAHDFQKTTEFMGTTKNIIASMKRDWMQTGRKPSGICGAAMYIAALSHGITCSTTDIAHIVHMCGATITKRLNEFANTEAATLTVEELKKSEKSILLEKTFTPRPNSAKEVVNCKHKDSKSFGYGLCKDCHEKLMEVSGGVVGGSDPPAFQRAEKERMEKAAREENEGGGIERIEEEPYWNAEASDESDNLSDLDGDPVVDGCILDEDEKVAMKKSWEFLNRDWLKEQADKEAALKTASEAFNASNANCPEYARNLVEASKASVTNSRKEKRQKRAEEAKNAPPASTPLEAVTRALGRKNISFNYDLLEELLDTSSGEKSHKKSRTETVIEKKEKEVEIEEEEEEEDEEQPYEMNTDEKFYEDQVEEEEDGYDFGLY